MQEWKGFVNMFQRKILLWLFAGILCFSGTWTADVQAAATGSQPAAVPLEIPDSYDAREHGLVTSVKNQGEYGTCWAFALLAAAEANLIKNGMADRSIDLSEYHLAFFGAMGMETVLHEFNDRGVTGGVEAILNRGGTLREGALYFAKWCGPVHERELPYITARQMEMPAVSLAGHSRYHLKTAVFASGEDREEIKTLVLDCGGAAVSYYDSEQYYNHNDRDNTCNYYVPNARAGSHAVCVVGWDDEYPKEKFPVMPPDNGAWLCKDSRPRHGDELGGGYLWISYATYLDEVVGLEFETTRRLQNNYRCDAVSSRTVLPGSDFVLDEVKEGVGIGLLTAGAGLMGLEKPEAVSFYAEREGTYRIIVYTDPEFTCGVLTGYSYRSHPISFAVKQQGIYCAELRDVIYVNKEKRFAVEVHREKIRSAGTLV